MTAFSTLEPSAKRRWRRRSVWLAAAALLGLAVSALLLRDVTTLQGVNYRVSAHRIPAYVKAIDFLQRHNHYRLLASDICANTVSEEACVMAILEWSRRTIVPTPPGWPVVDDHPLHIVIRGHGTPDQVATIFTLLAVYSGVPAFFRLVPGPDAGGVVLSFARLEGRWTVFDVANGVAFRNAGGALASVEELAADPALAGPGYAEVTSARTLLPFVPPRVFHGQMQQPWPRLRYEFRRAIGLERE